MKTSEQWKDIEGYQGYKVSSHGNVMGRYGRIKKPQRKSQRTDHLCIGLMNNGKFEMKNVHRLVAIAFIPNAESKPWVNHKDGNPKNNHVDNLEWVTANENAKHAYATGLYKKKKPISVESQQKILSLFEAGTRQRRIADQLGICRNIVSQVIKGTYKLKYNYNAA